MVVKILSAGIRGIEAFMVELEMRASRGHPGWTTVGLPEHEVREGKERVLSALQAIGFEIPQNKITLNLAPADVRKEGTAFDLPIAMGIVASRDLTFQKDLQDYLLVGELSLNGNLRPIRGALATALLAQSAQKKGLIVPEENLGEASLCKNIEVWGAKNLGQVVEYFCGNNYLAPAKPIAYEPTNLHLDFKEVWGQQGVKRVLEIAAAGFHPTLLVGPPGSGKSMLAKRLPSILPALNHEEMLHLINLKSFMTTLSSHGTTNLKISRPFRSPHHSISYAGMVGGGSLPKPGEVTMAHHGILFLDELPEFKKSVLECLRQPLEDKKITISRAKESFTFPTDFLLIAAMNPCPCGNYGYEPWLECSCLASDIKRYRQKLSGPLLDRIDLKTDVAPVPYGEMEKGDGQEPSLTIRHRIEACHQIQEDRFKDSPYRFNSQMDNEAIKRYCQLGADGKKILAKAMEKFRLSARSYTRILKVARTIADLAQVESIESAHLLEAIQYKINDRVI
ncbi:MAG: YifB family Mg chelatase-like AAA ATPase [Deltaproteobacteria bacterium]|nr:YifB family Mg chelatase-like AAA ATPase [Deltaproteobacteria bacterium]